MRAQIIILIISATTKFCGAKVKPVVTFTPNWRIILLYESMTLSCNLGSQAQDYPRYYWSKDGKLLSHHQRTIQIELSSEEDTGTYQCWINGGLKSDPVKLDVINTHLILQIPPVIYIGEPLTLRCHTFSTYQKINTTFFKNKTAIHFSVDDNELRFNSVDLNVAGIYHCSQQIFLHGKYKMFSATMIVSVQERPHTSLTGKMLTTRWVLVIILLLLLCSALLVFMCRHKLRFTRCRQMHAITEPERRRYSEEEDLHYSFIDMSHLPGGFPTQRSEHHDYSTVYSLITEAPSAADAGVGTETSLTTW
ncbi:low affinity immunoglobulin gamma Fc region receptor III-A-like [Anomaloglossus baeobatrachus]|uniref:low affinity immunoglobulin gamma Fc region receptor III-A-like n=1 Tax=Anomaloglossus baeobatrachus TaxID=238106 RepID=UPI003F504A3B